MKLDANTAVATRLAELNPTGAMVAEGIDDGEGHILRAIRNQFGPDLPISFQSLL